MSGSANVQRLDVVSEFAGGMQKFHEDAGAALNAIEQQVNRALEWIQHDAPAEAQRRIRHCEQKVAEAKAALDTAKVKNAGTSQGEGASLYDEKKAVDAAKQRLEDARDKYETIKRWAGAADREVDEFRGRIGALKRQFDSSIPKALSLLDRTRVSLERYLERQVGAGGPSSERAAGAFFDAPGTESDTSESAGTESNDAQPETSPNPE